MSGEEDINGMTLNKLDIFISQNEDVQIYPRYIIEYKVFIGEIVCDEEDWWSGDRGDDLFDYLQNWDDRAFCNLEDTLCIDIFYQEDEGCCRDYISRVYQHKDYTVEDIEKLT